MRYGIEHPLVFLTDTARGCMEMPVQKAVKEFNALNGQSEAILLLTVKLYAYPKPNPQPRDVTQVLMAAQRQRKEVERRPKVKHEDGGRRGKTALHNKVARYCLTESFTYNREHNTRDADNLFDELVGGLWLLNTVKQNNLTGTPKLVKDNKWLKVAAVQQDGTHHAPANFDQDTRLKAQKLFDNLASKKLFEGDSNEMNVVIAELAEFVRRAGATRLEKTQAALAAKARKRDSDSFRVVSACTVTKDVEPQVVDWRDVMAPSQVPEKLRFLDNKLRCVARGISSSYCNDDI